MINPMSIQGDLPLERDPKKDKQRRATVDVICDCLLPDYSTVRTTVPLEVPLPLFDDAHQKILVNSIRKKLEATKDIGIPFWFTIGRIVIPNMEASGSSISNVSLVGYSDIGSHMLNRDFCMQCTEIPTGIVHNKILPMLATSVNKDVWRDPKKRVKVVRDFLKSTKDRMRKLRVINPPKRNVGMVNVFWMSDDSYVYAITRTAQKIAALYTVLEFAALSE